MIAMTEPDGTGLVLRPPDQVMKLERMGSAFQTRLSFMRSLIRRMKAENWAIRRVRLDVDEQGFGVSVYEADTGPRVYSLIAYTSDLPPEKRTDRVIAEAWDATFTLFDGRPGDADIERLSHNVPRQEAGRCSPSELSLSRANKSMRLFDYVADCLARGEQPDIAKIAEVGYLMRTTAVYGNGKLGCSDRDRIAHRPELRGSFQLEMLSVYLTRQFTLDLVEHVAKCRNPSGAVPLVPEIRRFFGIGNATGLGMAPFLVTHPVLINNWVTARETALARVRALPCASEAEAAHFTRIAAHARQHVLEWSVSDERQTGRIAALRDDHTAIAEWIAASPPATMDHPWDALYRWAEQTLSLEGQEFVVSLLMEPYAHLVDDLAETMMADEVEELDPAMPVGELRRIVEVDYAWALEIDFKDRSNQQLFWYVSEEKLEPRVGDRYAEAGAEKEMPLAFARDVQALHDALAAADGLDESDPVALFLLMSPEHRHIVRRVQTTHRHPYAEIRSNLIGAACLPIDLLRCKLAFFGASKFDPRSDRWTRITMYQGAPLADELSVDWADDWNFPVIPSGTNP